MKIGSYKEIESKEVEGSSKLKIKWLNTDGSDNFAVRHCEIGSGGFSPFHKHPWEHELFVLEGNGLAINDKKSKPISAGDFISIPGNEIHQIKNTSNSSLRILCIISK